MTIEKHEHGTASATQSRNVVGIECPYCDTTIPYNRGFADHLPCEKTPTTEAVFDAD